MSVLTGFGCSKNSKEVFLNDSVEITDSQNIEKNANSSLTTKSNNQTNSQQKLPKDGTYRTTVPDYSKASISFNELDTRLRNERNLKPEVVEVPIENKPAETEEPISEEIKPQEPDVPQDETQSN